MRLSLGDRERQGGDGGGGGGGGGGSGGEGTRGAYWDARGRVRSMGRVYLPRSNIVSGTKKNMAAKARPVRPVPIQNCLAHPSSCAMYPPVMPPTTDPLAREAV